MAHNNKLVDNKADADAVAYASWAPREQLAELPFQHPELPAEDIRVQISYSGICHSDIHRIDGEWGDRVYPLVCGHEVVGTVLAVGSAVSDIQVGDRVGWGPLRTCCRTCDLCVADLDQLCEKETELYEPHFGGFATQIQAPAYSAFKIPQALPSEKVGPLLCAGATTFSPLKRFARAGDRVAIIGIGGLGHLGQQTARTCYAVYETTHTHIYIYIAYVNKNEGAVRKHAVITLQYANKMGCDVTAVSTSPGKEEEAKKFGAHHFLNSSDEEAMKAAKNRFDFILCTVSGTANFGGYLSILKPRGTLCLVGLPPTGEPLPLTALHFVVGERSVVGGYIGSRATTREMLEFSAANGIVPQIQVIPLSRINEGLDIVRNGQARYRIVLDCSQ